MKKQHAHAHKQRKPTASDHTSRMTSLFENNEFLCLPEGVDFVAEDSVFTHVELSHPLLQKFLELRQQRVPGTFLRGWF